MYVESFEQCLAYCKFLMKVNSVTYILVNIAIMRIYFLSHQYPLSEDKYKIMGHQRFKTINKISYMIFTLKISYFPYSISLHSSTEKHKMSPGKQSLSRFSLNQK